MEVLLFDDSTLQRPHWDGEIRRLQRPRLASRGSLYNLMLDAARGHFVWLLDSSEQLAPGAVSELRGIIHRDDPDLVLCDSVVLTPWTCPQYRRDPARPLAFTGPAQVTLADRSTLICRLLGPAQLHASSIISRRSLWAELRFPENHHHCERATLPRLALRAWTHHYAAACWIMHPVAEPTATTGAQEVSDLSTALFDFTREFRQFRHASRDARFLVSHACAHDFIQAASQTTDSVVPQAQRLPDYRRNFRRATLLPPGELLRRYQARGWQQPWQQLSHWLNASCAAAKQQQAQAAMPTLSLLPVPKIVNLH